MYLCTFFFCLFHLFFAWFFFHATNSGDSDNSDDFRASLKDYGGQSWPWQRWVTETWCPRHTPVCSSVPCVHLRVSSLSRCPSPLSYPTSPCSTATLRSFFVLRSLFYFPRILHRSFLPRVFLPRAWVHPTFNSSNRFDNYWPFFHSHRLLLLTVMKT